jgi:hypothetical protein
VTNFQDNAYRTNFLKLVFVFALLISILYSTAFYFRYAADAWFFQDDFMFIRTYEVQLHGEQWLSAANFGRFVSRNLYWWAGWAFFGPNAHGYFMFNLALMLSTSLLLLCLCLRHSLTLGLLLATAYWVAGASVSNLSWLSNSQHLLAHALMALYFCVAQRACRQESVPWLMGSFILYAVALSANVLSAVAVSFPMVYLCSRPRGRYAVATCATLAAQLGLALLLVFTVRPESGSPYAMTLALPVVFKNMAGYYGHPVIFLGFSGLLLRASWARLGVGDLLEAWLLLAGPAFILPFLPLAQQHYLNYAAFSHVFMLVGLIILAVRARGRWSRLVALSAVAFLVWVFAIQTYRQIAYFKYERRGATQRELVRALNDVVHSKGIPVGSTLCFSEHGEAHMSGSPLPSFWWGLGFGDAFKKFVGEEYKYELLSDDVACTYDLHVDGSRLHWLSR